ncbi:tetratricopeptide repeat protein [Myxacorys almedinensis]|uniref:Tetratricopeptide repeat protein n=1 Tax=Myxacorys almedinensis A TaxID=2690445 RepID=A0A8J7Z3S8_9CYAN|nr:tetratricopeptide repeat protein [Myxacorys almedinensis]NDJ15958.1 tetratricopeptide repeat protein [Myxacorys almedinensis A]
MSDSFGRRNPYVIGRPIVEPEMFFGRETLFEFIEDNLLQGAQVILLHGQRRIGKSSVLAQIPNFVKLKDFEFVPLSLEGDSRKPIGVVLHELARDSLDYFERVSDRVDVPTIAALTEQPQLFVDRFLPDLREALGVKNIVLLLDEFDAVGNYRPDMKDAAGHLFPFLQSEVYQHRDLYIIPVVGRQLTDLGSLLSLFREAPYQEVGRLDRRSAEKLITKPAGKILEYFPGAIDEILELSAGHPYFTQLLCFSLFVNARQEGRWKVIRDDVRKIVDQAIEFGEGGLAWFWDGIPLPERVVFSAAAEVPELKLAAHPTDLILDFTETEPLDLLREHGVIVTEEIRRSIANLVNWKFLQASTPRRPWVRSATMPPSLASYRVTIELVRRWLVSRHPIRKEIKELGMLSRQAHELYEIALRDRELHGATPAIVTLLDRVLKLNPNHFKALLELASTLAELEQFPSAIAYYERAYLLDPVRVKDAYVKAFYNYAQELRDMGQFDEAFARLQDALEIEPDNEQAWDLLNQLRRAKEMDEKLKLSPLKDENGHGIDLQQGIESIESIDEVEVEEKDLSMLHDDFSHLVEQVNAEAPNEWREKALERLDDLQREIFNRREVDLATLAYVHRWFYRNLPSALSQTMTDFIDTVISRTFGRHDREEKSEPREDLPDKPEPDQC